MSITARRGLLIAVAMVVSGCSADGGGSPSAPTSLGDSAATTGSTEVEVTTTPGQTVPTTTTTTTTTTTMTTTTMVVESSSDPFENTTVPSSLVASEVQLSVSVARTPDVDSVFSVLESAGRLVVRDRLGEQVLVDGLDIADRRTVRVAYDGRNVVVTFDDAVAEVDAIQASGTLRHLGEAVLDIVHHEGMPARLLTLSSDSSSVLVRDLRTLEVVDQLVLTDDIAEKAALSQAAVLWARSSGSGRIAVSIDGGDRSGRADPIGGVDDPNWLVVFEPGDDGHTVTGPMPFGPPTWTGVESPVEWILDDEALLVAGLYNSVSTGAVFAGAGGLDVWGQARGESACGLGTDLVAVATWTREPSGAESEPGHVVILDRGSNVIGELGDQMIGGRIVCLEDGSVVAERYRQVEEAGEFALVNDGIVVLTEMNATVVASDEPYSSRELVPVEVSPL